MLNQGWSRILRLEIGFRKPRGIKLIILIGIRALIIAHDDFKRHRLRGGRDGDCGPAVAVKTKVSMPLKRPVPNKLFAIFCIDPS